MAELQNIDYPTDRYVVLKTKCFLVGLTFYQLQTQPLQTLPEAQQTQGIESITPALEIECHLHWFQTWPIVCGSTCISSKFESVSNLANM